MFCTFFLTLFCNQCLIFLLEKTSARNDGRNGRPMNVHLTDSLMSRSPDAPNGAISDGHQMCHTINYCYNNMKHR